MAFSCKFWGFLSSDPPSTCSYLISKDLEVLSKDLGIKRLAELSSHRDISEEEQTPNPS